MTTAIAEGDAIKAVAQATARGDWAGAAAGAEGLLDLLVRNIAVRNDQVVRDIGSVAGELSLNVIVDHDIPAESTPVVVATLLRALAGAAAVAGRGAVRAEDGDTRTRILEALILARGQAITNVDLARACGRSEETISRVLKSMRAEGLVLSRRAGRAKQNWVTEAGRRTYEGGHDLMRWFVNLDTSRPDAVEAISVRELLITEQAHEMPAETLSVEQVVQATA